MGQTKRRERERPPVNVTGGRLCLNVGPDEHRKTSLTNSNSVGVADVADVDAWTVRRQDLAPPPGTPCTPQDHAGSRRSPHPSDPTSANRDPKILRNVCVLVFARISSRTCVGLIKDSIKKTHQGSGVQDPNEWTGMTGIRSEEGTAGRSGCQIATAAIPCPCPVKWTSTGNKAGHEGSTVRTVRLSAGHYSIVHNTLRRVVNGWNGDAGSRYEREGQGTDRAGSGTAFRGFPLAARRDASNRSLTASFPPFIPSALPAVCIRQRVGGRQVRIKVPALPATMHVMLVKHSPAFARSRESSWAGLKIDTSQLDRVVMEESRHRDCAAQHAQL